MKKRALFYVFFIIFVLTTTIGCSSDDVKNENNDIVTVPRSTVYTVETKVLTESLTADDGTELIYISVEYPEISNPCELENVDEINLMYSDNAQLYIDSVKAEFGTDAETSYAAAPDEFERYKFEVFCDITYNKNCFLSVKRSYDEKYEDFDGHEIYGDVYDMSVGLPLYADEIVTASGEEMLQLIFLGFTSVAEQYPERFVDGYTDILNESIKGTEFYLTDTAMVFVLQPGIATYSEYGCLTFEMPYEGNTIYFLKLYEK